MPFISLVSTLSMPVWLLVTTTLAGARAEPSTLPFRQAPEGAIVVDVRIDGAGPFPFLLDTGSNQSAVSSRLSRALRLTPVSSTMVVGTVSREVRPIVKLDRVRLDRVTAIGVTTDTVFATVTPDAALVGGRVDGVLGQDVLGALHYTVDFATRRITWHAADTGFDDRDREWVGHGSVTLPLEPVDGRFVVSLPQQAGTLRLVPDSGAQGLVLFDRGTPIVADLHRTAGGFQVTGMVGRTEVPAMRVRELRIGPKVLRDYPVAVLPRRETVAPRGDGLLPLHIFSRVTFNGRARTMTIVF